MTLSYKFKYSELVFFLLIFANILNLFASRGSFAGEIEPQAEGLISRDFIQYIYIIILFLMVIPAFLKRHPKYFISLKILLLLSVSYLIFYLFGSDTTVKGFYIKLIFNITAFLYFYNLKIEQQRLILYLKLFSITFVISIVYKLLSGSLFTSEKLGAGDTASIGLVFIAPLFYLIYPKRNAHIIFILLFAFTLLSVRRTSILAMLASAFFLFSFRKINLKQILLLSVPLVVAIYLVFQFAGNAILERFTRMVSPEAGQSMGSGREFYYLELISSFIDGPKNQLFGFGVGGILNHFNTLGIVYFNHAHNDFLELIYTFGLIGFFSWIFFLISVYLRRKLLFEIHKQVFYSTFFSYLIVALFSGALIRFEFLPFVLIISLLISPNMSIKKT